MDRIPAGAHTRCATSSGNGVPLHALGDQREQHIAPVAVRESFIGSELLRVPAENREVLLGCPQLVNRYGHHVVVDREVGLFVEVVADARPVREQLLDGHVVGDQRKIASEYRTRRCFEAQKTLLDQTHDRECGQPFHTTRNREPGLVRDGHGVGAVRKPVRTRERDLVSDVDPHDS